jgi:DNA-binding transcriptional MerR regulator
MAKRGGKAYYMISAVAQSDNIHPQTLRPNAKGCSTVTHRRQHRLYSEEDLNSSRPSSPTRDLGVNLAGSRSS